MKVAIVIPDGVGIKNYLYADFVDQLLKQPNAEIAIITSLETAFFDQLFHGAKAVKVYKIPAYRERKREYFFREMVRQARLLFFTEKLANPTIIKAQASTVIKGKKQFLWLAQRAGAILAARGYNAILKAEKRYKKTLSQRPLPAHQQLLETIRPDIIISTHQRPIGNIPLYEQARRMGIIRTSVIYSWDNVSKGNINTPSEHYFLWSTFMKDQMNIFYPEVKDSMLYITGTPQFSFYKNASYQWEKEAFYNAFHIPANKKIVLFSGSDTRTSPFDPELLKDVAAVINSMPAESRPVLVFRRSPADFSGRYNEVLKADSDIISIDPIWDNNGTGWDTAVPRKEDVKNIVGLMQFCSIIINVSSTMALDGAVLNKPSLYIAYTPDNAPHFNYKEMIHSEDHLKILKDINAVEYVETKADLGRLITGILEDDSRYCKDRQVFLQRVTDNIISEAGSNIVNEMVRLYKAKQKA